MRRRGRIVRDDVASLSVPFNDRDTDPTFAELTLEELWDMVKRVRTKSGPRQQVYTLAWPLRGTVVDVTVRRR